MKRGAILTRLIEAITATPARSRPDELGRTCRDLLGADGTAITIENSVTNRVTLTATDSTAARLEDLQDVLGEGPGHAAYGAGEPVAAHLETDRRWPEFVRSALAAVGPLTIRCFPIRPGGRPFGVLSAYVTDGRKFTESPQTSQFLADALGVALLNDPPPTGDEPDDHSPWMSRAVVHQATGMIAGHLGLAIDDASALLRARAYARDETLARVAQLIVSRRLQLDG
ncbi:ANTAR domain-containing protein [Kribbella capetownensis]|uniref:ANTAR domain-containing protein n=1 Tax=Kribbella capetownensis TaxID=1572659 RepID=A0A4R0JDZ1_9ACTN|nr:GAF and ANTAR domain-containing protein [Kribbella capetownensis]TCC44287.1 ANTAR domain-containing protein [Kribbella capetownensis]